MSLSELRRYTIIGSLIKKLKENGSWCGETHVQKATFFLEALLRVPLNYDFILYKHGPYSFELNQELSAMRADAILRWKSQFPYGPSIEPTETFNNLKERFDKTLQKFSKEIDFVAKKLGQKNVAELECLATALFVTMELGKETDKNIRAKQIVRLKPHIPLSTAINSVEEVDEIIQETEGSTFS